MICNIVTNISIDQIVTLIREQIFIVYWSTFDQKQDTAGDLRIIVEHSADVL